MLDIFNRKRVSELLVKINKLETDAAYYRNEIERLKKKEGAKKHVTGPWCEGCKNYKTRKMSFGIPVEFCALDNPCFDREEE